MDEDIVMRAARAAVFPCLALLCGCQSSCPAGLARQPEALLFFGGSVPDDAWDNFSAIFLNSAFPDGFTVYEAAGQWRDPNTHQIVRERTRVVQVFGPATPAQVSAVRATYRTRFHQTSVGAVVRSACAAF